MTTEREMLEYAAKACGISVKPMEIKNVTQHGDDRFIGLLSEDWPRGWFNPLTSSADCAAMCAKLKIETLWAYLGHFVECANDGRYYQARFEEHNNDPEAAWRYAATMVAAKIGGMK